MGLIPSVAGPKLRERYNSRVAGIGYAANASGFEQAFTVDAPFSSSPVWTFALDGSRPWLFLDPPGLGSLFTTVETERTSPLPGSPVLELIPSHSQGDHFSVAPSEQQCAAAQAAGALTIAAKYALVGIPFAGNGGIGVGTHEGPGNAVVTFEVVPAAVPLPPALMLALLPLSTLGESSGH